MERQIALEKMFFDAYIGGLFAQVFAKQEFHNHGVEPIEGIYTFSLPDEASIHACEIKIGSRVKVQAQLHEKRQAQQLYDQGISGGQYGSILRQHRANVFSLNIGGIEPNEHITVTIVYSQRVFWQHNGGRFNIPLVLAPRFIPSSTMADAAAISPPILPQGVPYQATINVHLSPGFRCRVKSPSHPNLRPFHMNSHESQFLVLNNLDCDRDFILTYENTDQRSQVSMHVTQRNNETFHVVTLFPPGHMLIEPLDVVYCLDCSGSMEGMKIQGLIEVCENLTHKLEADRQYGIDHRVGVVGFNTGIRRLQDLSEINPATYAAIRELRADGGTKAGQAIDYCFDVLAKPQKGRKRFMVFVGDGQTEDRWTKIGDGIYVITVGIDSAANLSFLRELARMSNGTCLPIYPGEDYNTATNTILGFLSGPIVTDLKVTAPEIEPSNVLGSSQIYASMPGVLYLKGKLPAGQILIEGITNQNKRYRAVLNSDQAQEIPFADKLWTRAKMRGEISPQEMLALSLKYGVLSNETAFVAVVKKVHPSGPPVQTYVPVSLPATWEYRIDPYNQSHTTAQSLGMFNFPGSKTRGKVLEAAMPIMASKSSREDDDGNVPMLDRLESLVTAFERGQINLSPAEQQLDKLLQQFTTEYTRWNVTDKARAYFLLMKLQYSGFKIQNNLIQEVSSKPDTTATEALAWWKQAQKYIT
jgi:Ca-activated chloride channel family protein